MSASPLLTQYLPQLRTASIDAPVLDLACGSGRNGLLLVEHDIPVVFADVRREALDQAKRAMGSAGSVTTRFWQIDLEQSALRPLENQRFGAILIFRYLHRPLMRDIKQAILPGGLVVYETFTLDQASLGRPKNPDFLLQSGELRGYFASWNILHYFEGRVENTDTGNPQAIARLVARKPLTGPD